VLRPGGDLDYFLEEGGTGTIYDGSCVSGVLIAAYYVSDLSHEHEGKIEKKEFSEKDRIFKCLSKKKNRYQAKGYRSPSDHRRPP